MNLNEIIKKLNLEIITAKDRLDVQITGGYASDLLSDVIANTVKGNIWLTLQTHQNIVAVAILKELSGIILVNNRKPEEETIKKAQQENVPILISKLSTFELAGQLYQLGIKASQKC
ncbi:MAG: DRTGG domain-containing protein [Acidobacteriota bacterium]